MAQQDVLAVREKLARLLETCTDFGAIPSALGSFLLEELQAKEVYLKIAYGEVRASYSRQADPHGDTSLDSTVELRSGKLLVQNREISEPTFYHGDEGDLWVVPVADGAVVAGVVLVEFDSARSADASGQHASGQWLLLHVAEQLHRKMFVLDEIAAGAPKNSGESELVSSPLVDQGQVIIIRTSPNFQIRSVVGDTQALIGYEPAELLAWPDAWRAFVHPEDLRALGRQFRKLRETAIASTQELRVVHRHSHAVRWLVVRAVVDRDTAGRETGWEFLGIDITGKRQVQEELRLEKRRLEALYEVASTLEINRDPASVTLRGLRALIHATNSDSGIGCFYDETADRLDIVAADGLSETYLSELARVINQRSLAKLVAASKEGMIVDDLPQDKRALADLAGKEGLRAAILIPVMFEDRVLGVLGVFCKRPSRYGQADLDLVDAAASQIGLALRQAESYTSERVQANALGTLYRLSHAVSRLFTPAEIAAQALPILQQELACKRMWIGFVNDQGSHIVGHGGLGPGVRRPVIELQIELDLRHDGIDEAVRTKKPVIVRAGQKVECSGLNRIVERLQIGTVIVVPLVSLDQVVGILVVEPALPSVLFVERKLPLLTRMASEIATVILARRFESKISDADKMRMAGVLASGVAHNFNNLLQAVMGQASLIEIQSPKDSPMAGSARMIIDAAGKGAGLIKQLLAFTLQGAAQYQRLRVNQFLKESRELYESVLGADITLEVDMSAEEFEIFADYTQLQQVITNLIVNAKEAVSSVGHGKVTLSAREVRLNSGEVDPELAPGAYARIDVVDNGVGMTPEHLARCFEPFYTTKNTDSGTGIGLEGSGLGLSSAYSIVKQHHGIIAARSQPGLGSTFSVYVPLSQAFSGEAGVQPRVDRPKAVLVGLADQMAGSVKTTLESLGWQVFTQIPRAELIATVSQSRLLMVDAEELRHEVVRLATDVVRASPQLKIILLTEAAKKWGNLLRRFPTLQVMEKPLSMIGLQAVVRRILLVPEAPSFESKRRLEDKVEMSDVGKGSTGRYNRRRRFKMKRSKNLNDHPKEDA